MDTDDALGSERSTCHLPPSVSDILCGPGPDEPPVEPVKTRGESADLQPWEDVWEDTGETRRTEDRTGTVGEEVRLTQLPFFSKINYFYL